MPDERSNPLQNLPSQATTEYQSYKLQIAQSRRLMNMPLVFRDAGSGYWTLFLLPLGIYFADFKFGSQSFSPVVIILYNSIFLLGLYVIDRDNLHIILRKLKKVNFFLAIGALVYCFISKGSIYEYAAYVTLNFSFPYVFKNFVRNYPSSFTFGEVMIVTSAFVYNFWAVSQNLVIGNLPDIQKTNDSIMVTLATEMTFFGTILLARFILFYSNSTRFFVLEELLCVWAKGSLLAFVLKLQNPPEDIWYMINWLFRYIFGTRARIVYLIYWIMLVWVSGSYVYLKSRQVTDATIVDRKFFHLVITLVYFPVIINDFSFIFFCSAVVFNMFLIIEAVRVLKIEIYGIQFGNMVNELVIRFRDDRDSGPLILTPIYLLVGCSAPIWLTGLYYENNNTNDLSPEDIAAGLTGILSIGVGDTVASIVGTLYGRIHWPGSRKTVEGTVCSMVAQIFVVFLLVFSGYLPYTTLSVVALIVSSVINASVEAFTDQIDNLVVPLAAFNAVHCVIFINDKFGLQL